jgi:hypothetical protein
MIGPSLGTVCSKTGYLQPHSEIACFSALVRHPQLQGMVCCTSFLQLGYECPFK